MRSKSSTFKPAHALTTGPVTLEAARMVPMSSISCRVMGVCASMAKAFRISFSASPSEKQPE